MKNYARNQINIHIMFCLTAIAALLLISSGTAAADYVYVNSMEGSGGYQTIQAAVNNVSSYDTIIVAPGTYNENVDIPADKDNLTIRSESGPGLTKVQASTSEDHVFDVAANSTTIDGFSITGATGYKSGIYLDHVEGCSILNNTASNNYYGIRLDSSSSNTLENNNASNNDYGISLESSSSNELVNNTANSNNHGIYLYGSSNDNTLSNNTANSNNYHGIDLSYSSSNTLSNNTANSNNCGIYLDSSSSSILSENRMQNNKCNFYADGDFLDTNIVYANNSVDGKPIYYLVEVSDLEINSSSNAGTVYLIDCKNIIVKDLIIEKEGYGILLYNTTDSKLENNTASYNFYGIWLYSSSSNTLSNNTANSNTKDAMGSSGIRLYSSSNNKLENNTASYNTHGIRLYSSSSNTLSNNTANSNNYGGIILTDSSSNTLENNTASDNRGGFDLSSSSSNKLSNNTANSNNDCGIRLYSSNNNELENNTANSNTNCGIKLTDSSSNTLSNNTANSNSDIGIWLYSLWTSSNDNMLFRNDLLNNSVQIREDGNNFWNGSEPVNYLYNGERKTSYLGNYYSDYEGLDGDENGVGDTPYVFNSTTPLVNDSYPLMNASDNYILLAFDNEAPVINSIEFSPTTPYAGDSILVTVNATDNISVYSVKASGTALTCIGGDIWQGNLIAEEGTHPVNISAADAWGNVVWDNSSSYITVAKTESHSSSGGSGTGEARIIPAGTGAADEPGEESDEKEDESDGSVTLISPTGDTDTSEDPTASDVAKATGEEGSDEGNDEEKGAPGFEIVFAVSGLLAALYFVRKE